MRADDGRVLPHFSPHCSLHSWRRGVTRLLLVSISPITLIRFPMHPNCLNHQSRDEERERGTDHFPCLLRFLSNQSSIHFASPSHLMKFTPPAFLPSSPSGVMSYASQKGDASRLIRTPILTTRAERRASGLSMTRRLSPSHDYRMLTLNLSADDFWKCIRSRDILLSIYSYIPTLTMNRWFLGS